MELEIAPHGAVHQMENWSAVVATLETQVEVVLAGAAATLECCRNFDLVAVGDVGVGVGVGPGLCGCACGCGSVRVRCGWMWVGVLVW